jgi:hypothetical protein
MQYPCIIYRRDGSQTEYAENRKYHHTKRYQVTVVDRNPDTELSDKWKNCRSVRLIAIFPAENLNHYVFTLFF